MSHCVFCKIINKEIPANIVYEDNEVLAFDDINPKAAIHKLIIPKLHVATINNLEERHESVVGKLFRTASHIAKELNIAEDGYRVIMNCNKHGGQEVYHIHLHMIGGQQLHWHSELDE